MHILIVEDEKDIQELLKSFLKKEGYEVTSPSDSVEALSLFSSHSYDLVLLDLMLPKVDGYGVCEFIRKTSEIPIIMLTALDSEHDQLKGFDYNIDDYIIKPFSVNILLKKIRAILRRTANTKDNQKTVYRDLILDADSCTVLVHDVLVLLTPREYSLLNTLLENKGRVLSRQQLLDGLWSYDFYGNERVIDTHIKNLRHKLNVDYIHSIRGSGYRIDKENQKTSGIKDFYHHFTYSDQDGTAVTLPTEITTFAGHTVIDVAGISATKGYENPISNFSFYNSATKSYFNLNVIQALSDEGHQHYLFYDQKAAQSVVRLIVSRDSDGEIISIDDMTADKYEKIFE